MSADASVRDIKFALNCLELERLLAHERFKDFSPEMFNEFVDEANKLATEKIAPLNVVSDREGVSFHPKTGKVTTPKEFKEAFKLYSEGLWGVASVSPELGGMGIPEAVAVACAEPFIGACSAFSMVHGLTRSAADVIAEFGTPEQKAKYLANMISAKWTGTMCLTESHSGSDLGGIRTSATPIEGKPGHYKIRGTKTFISFGEHDLAENIIHLVLARTPGAPNGTKGISLFIVPKMKIGADGTVTGKKNDVVCGGIEHKMGIHGSPTCTLNFGEKDQCEGELIGDEMRGMQYMFLMMNEARLAVGLQGLSLAAASLDDSIAYAKERLQGCNIREFGNPAAKRVPIIVHHDVRRMLMTMKAETEGMRALVYHVAHYLDMSRTAETEEERHKYHGWVELLTPVVKAYCTDTGFAVTKLGVMVHGGAGYCGDYRVEQYLRDAMILPIYEGTNGIQALDLLLRKIPKEKGKVLQSFAEEMVAKLETLKEHRAVGKLAKQIEDALEQFSVVLFGLADRSAADVALVNACAVLEIFGAIASAFFLVEQAAVASDKLDHICGPDTDDATHEKICAENTEAKFFSGKIATATFFVAHLLPRVSSRMHTILGKDTSCMKDVL